MAWFGNRRKEVVRYDIHFSSEGEVNVRLSNNSLKNEYYINLWSLYLAKIMFNTKDYSKGFKENLLDRLCMVIKKPFTLDSDVIKLLRLNKHIKCVDTEIRMSCRYNGILYDGNNMLTLDTFFPYQVNDYELIYSVFALLNYVVIKCVDNSKDSYRFFSTVQYLTMTYLERPELCKDIMSLTTLPQTALSFGDFSISKDEMGYHRYRKYFEQIEHNLYASKEYIRKEVLSFQIAFNKESICASIMLINSADTEYYIKLWGLFFTQTMFVLKDYETPVYDALISGLKALLSEPFTNDTNAFKLMKIDEDLTYTESKIKEDLYIEGTLYKTGNVSTLDYFWPIKVTPLQTIAMVFTLFEYVLKRAKVFIEDNFILYDMVTTITNKYEGRVKTSITVESTIVWVYEAYEQANQKVKTEDKSYQNYKNYVQEYGIKHLSSLLALVIEKQVSQSLNTYCDKFKRNNGISLKYNKIYTIQVELYYIYLAFVYMKVRVINKDYVENVFKGVRSSIANKLLDMIISEIGPLSETSKEKVFIKICDKECERLKHYVFIPSDEDWKIIFTKTAYWSLNKLTYSDDTIDSAYLYFDLTEDINKLDLDVQSIVNS